MEGDRPPACTLYSALAAEFIAKNLSDVIGNFNNENLEIFSTNADEYVS